MFASADCYIKFNRPQNMCNKRDYQKQTFLFLYTKFNFYPSLACVCVFIKEHRNAKKQPTEHSS